MSTQFQERAVLAPAASAARSWLFGSWRSRLGAMFSGAFAAIWRSEQAQTGGFVSGKTMMQHIVDMARAACDAPYAELVIASEPRLQITSSEDPELHQTGLTPEATSAPSLVEDVHNNGTEADGFAPWVGSIASVPIVGPSAEAGWLAVADARPGQLDSASLNQLNDAVALIEDRLDRTVEQDRLDKLGEILRDKQDDLRLTRDRLEVSNQELEQFAYIAAHELVAPLRAVAVYAELLESIIAACDLDNVTELEVTKVTECATEIRGGVTLMNRQVQYLLELSRAQVDVTDPDEVELDYVVHQAVDTLQEQLTEAGATVDVEPLPRVAGRVVPLQSVFANLISNALRYRSPDRPLKIAISSQPCADGVRVSVIDNGSGVAHADATRIFQLFERASTDAPGSGIGLALSRRIVEAFGGSIGVEPTAGQGAEFWIKFPLVS